MRDRIQLVSEPAPIEPVGEFEGQHYVWKFIGSPVRINLGLDVVARMRKGLAGSFDAKSEGRWESGGFLLGTAENARVEIDDFEPFACNTPGDHFVISDADLPRFRAALERLKRSGSQRSVVGFYRSHTRDGARLSDQDLVLIHECFRNPLDVFLIVGPEPGGPPKADFFFWDHGNINDIPLMTFPFDEKQLVAIEPAPEVQEETAHAEDELDTPIPISVRWAPTRLSLGIILAIAIFVLASATLFTKRNQPTQAEAPLVPIALNATSSANNVTVTWNPRSTIVGAARVGLLTIKDGNVQHEVPLTKPMLTGGKIAYTAAGNSVQVQLEVFSTTGQSTKEMLLVLVNQAGRANNVSPVTGYPAFQTEVKVARTFTPPPLPIIAETAPSFRTEAAPVVAEAPALVSPSGLQSVDPNMLRAPAMPAPAASPTPVAAVPAPETIVTPSQQAPPQPPRPIRQVKPDLPANVRDSLSREVLIDVRLTIDERGKVLKAEPLPQKGGIGEFLAAAAANAARLWRFEPAQQAGRAVPSELVVQFRFSPQKTK